MQSKVKCVVFVRCSPRIRRRFNRCVGAVVQLRDKSTDHTARAKGDDVLALAAQGKNPSEIAAAVGIGRGAVYRILDTAKAMKAEAQS